MATIMVNGEEAKAYSPPCLVTQMKLLHRWEVHGACVQENDTIIIVLHKQQQYVYI